MNALEPKDGGQNEDVEEKQLWEGGYSPKDMYGSTIGLAAITLALLIGGAMFLSSGIGWAVLAVIIVLMWIYQVGTLGVRKLSVHYKLSSKRFIHQAGILARTTDRIEVIDMDDITFRQGVVQRIFGVGTIKISSSDRSHPVLELKGINDVRKIANLFDDARLAERSRRGLHIENI